MNHLLAFAALVGLFYSTEVQAQSASASLHISVIIPEVLYVAADRASPTSSGAQQVVTVRATLKSGYCVQPTYTGSNVITSPSILCSSVIGETVFVFDHQFTAQSQPVFSANVFPR